MDIPPHTEDLDAVLALAQRLLADPDDFSRSDVHKLARIAVDFVATSKKYAALETRYAELSQTSDLRRTHAILQKDYVELAESKTQTIERCTSLLNENRRIRRMMVQPAMMRELAKKLEWMVIEIEKNETYSGEFDEII